MLPSHLTHHGECHGTTSLQLWCTASIFIYLSHSFDWTSSPFPSRLDFSHVTRSFHPYFFSLVISSSPVIACVRCAGQEEVSGGVAVHSGATAPLVTGDWSLACHSSIDPHIHCADIDIYAYELSRNKPQSLIRFVSSLSSLLHLLLLVSNEDFTHHWVPEDFVHAEQC